MSGSFVIRKATLNDMSACAAIRNDWTDATQWMPRVYPRDDVERHYRETVFAERDAYVVDDSESVVAMIFLSDDAEVTSLYVAADQRGRGYGKALLDQAKSVFPSGLQLWTFVENTGARRFYEREDFVEEQRTDGDNEEGLADIHFRWDGKGANSAASGQVG